MPLKILFVSFDTSQTRHFISTFAELERRGHHIEILIKHKGPPLKSLPSYLKHIRTLKLTPLVWPRGFWGRYAKAFRATRNYFLYYDPRFDGTTVFRQRAYDRVDPFLSRWTPAEGPAPVWTRHMLDAVEAAIPADPDILAFMQAGGYDLVLVSPYIFDDSTVHTDYVKCAHHLGIPVGFPVFSWDNLTTKGCIQVMPDRVWVWNETQRRELIELHGVPEPVATATGAYRFDDYRAFKPSKPREAFAAELGLDASRPIVVYLGSSPAVAPNEGELVGHWIAAVRGSSDPVVAGANIVVRSHPRNVDAWANLDSIVNNERVAFQKPVASLLWETQNLFDTLTHAKAAVGLNTSAMLEAAIHRLPVHTVKNASAHGGQEGTVHFRYLTTVGGGLLQEAVDLPEHCALLARSLTVPDGTPDPKTEAFFAAFIDGADDPRAPTQRFVDDVEALARLPKSPRRRRLRDRAVDRVVTALIKAKALKLREDPDFDWPNR